MYGVKEGSYDFCFCFCGILVRPSEVSQRGDLNEETLGFCAGMGLVGQQSDSQPQNDRRFVTKTIRYDTTLSVYCCQKVSVIKFHYVNRFQ